MSTFQSKKRLTSAWPRLVVERTVTRPGTELTASSMGLVMVTCICSTGMTPLSTPMTTRGKIRLGKDGDGHLEGKVDAGHGEHRRKEEDGARGAGQPEVRMGSAAAAGLCVRHQSSPPPLPAAGCIVVAAGPTFTLVPSSSP